MRTDQFGSRLSRRDFLRLSAMAALGFMGRWGESATATRRPNILFILTDQQHAGMLSCTGNSWVKTPNMDRLAARGTRFERAYASNPVCVPSRFTMMTGQMPSVIGMESNYDSAKSRLTPEIFSHAMGRIFRDAGYYTVYGGKRHMAGQQYGKETMAAFGFEEDLALADTDGRQPTVEACVRFLKSPHERPFLLVASLINPHDICLWGIPPRPDGKWTPLTPSAQVAALIKQIGNPPEGMTEEEFCATQCPPLPPNHEPPAHELTAAVKFRGARQQAIDGREWQRYRRAYAKLVELVDGQVGQILGALREAGLEDNTLVVFTSDHGDMDAAHRMTGKSVLYEESARVPFIISWQGGADDGQAAAAGRVDREHLVSNGLDLIPTLCDYASISLPSALKGRSVRPLVEAQTKGQPIDNWRDHLVVESERMRALYTGKWKYTVGHQRTVGEAFLKKAGATEPVREVLIDLERDPGEMTNRASEPDARPILARTRQLLRQWYRDHDLALDQGYIVAPEKAVPSN